MNFSKILFYLSAAGFVFAFGLIVGAYQIWPYQPIKFVLNSVESVVADRDNLLGDKPLGFLAGSRYDGNGVTRHDPTRVAPGYTLLAGFFEDLPELRLVRHDGSVVQRWPVEYLSLFDDADHVFPASDRPAGNWNAAVHGTTLLPDGSVVFNFDGKGTVKLDKCGNRLWSLPRMTHHSLERAEGGGYWAPSRHFVENNGANALFKRPYRDDTILRFSDSGEVLSEISVNRILVDNGLYALLVGNGRFPVNMQEDDVLHMNDIEELKAERAAAFPLFAAGDLLLSLRHLNMLMVVEPQSWQVKWYQIGPWLRQHDADFQADGTISVFNNNSDDTKDGDILPGSQIMSIQPFSANRQVDVLYGDSDGEKFFTNTQGKHQRLPNGNFLIAEYYAGRAFEVAPDGEVVWEYINQYDEEYVAKISAATRYPEDYFTVRDWQCPGAN